jgi:hypothetical protein
LGDDLGAGLGDDSGDPAAFAPVAWDESEDFSSPPPMSMTATEEEEHAAMTPTAAMILTRLDIFYTILRDLNGLLINNVIIH